MVLDTFTRLCPVIAVDTSFTGEKVATFASAVDAQRVY
jgi:hypothetical protein